VRIGGGGAQRRHSYNGATICEGAAGKLIRSRAVTGPGACPKTFSCRKSINDANYMTFMVKRSAVDLPNFSPQARY